MMTLTSDLESDSFLSGISMEAEGQVDDFRRALDLEGERLNQVTMNNREIVQLQSQLAKCRCQLEKSEMLRQTLELELTLLRAQHGKQMNKTQQLQVQLETTQEQVKKFESQLSESIHQREENVKHRDNRIHQLENEAEALHERERRIHVLNEQIERMEKTFAESENLSHKYLADSMLAKEREGELKREHDVVVVKVQFLEQSLDTERSLCNEARLNAQLLASRLADLESSCETLKSTRSNQERKIDELQRQCSNEKLLRATLAKLQSEIEIKSVEFQKMSIDYEKQLKQLRDEIGNFRRKYRTTEEKHQQCNTKILDLLRLARLVNESTNVEQFSPTLKQFEELKIYLEQLRIAKVDQTNEISRLKKGIERMNKSSVNQRQIEHDAEVHHEKLKEELEQCRHDKFLLEEEITRYKRREEHLNKEIQSTGSILSSIHQRFVHLLGSQPSNLQSDLNLLERQWNSLTNRCVSLEQQLIERDTGTLQLTQKLEEQVQRMTKDLDLRHKQFITQRDSLKEQHQRQLNEINQQLKTMEFRAHEAEHRLSKQEERNEERTENDVLVRHLLSLLVPLRRRQIHLLESNRLVTILLNINEKTRRLVHPTLSPLLRFRKVVIAVLAFRRLLLGYKSSSLVRVRASNIVYDKTLLLPSTITNEQMKQLQTLLERSTGDERFQSFLIQLDHLSSSTTSKGSMIKLLFAGLSRSLRSSSSPCKMYQMVHSLLVRLDQSESLLTRMTSESAQLRSHLVQIESQFESTVDFNQFEQICQELERALQREKEAQNLLNEQNNQLKALTDIVDQTQKERDQFKQFNQLLNNQICESDRKQKETKHQIRQLTQMQSQMEINVKRAEKAIRLVVSDKEEIASFCARISSALNASERRAISNLEQMLNQLDGLVQLPSADGEKKSSPELVSCQTMAVSFVTLFTRLIEELVSKGEDIRTLKDHCQMLTEQFGSLSRADVASTKQDSSQSIVVQAHPVLIQTASNSTSTVHHHPQSAFKPIRPDFD